MSKIWANHVASENMRNIATKNMRNTPKSCYKPTEAAGSGENERQNVFTNSISHTEMLQKPLISPLLSDTLIFVPMSI